MDEEASKKAIANYREVQAHAKKVVSRLSSLQRKARRSPGGWPWGNGIAELEAEVRATSKAEDEGYENVRKWANSVE